jgi:general secretion pathway protein D
MRVIRVNIIVIIILLFYGCGSTAVVLNKADEAVKKTDWDSAVKYYLKALERKPDSVKYKISLSKAMFSASNKHLKNCIELYKTENYKLAIIECEKSVEYNPENNKARRVKLDILKVIEKIKNERKRKTKIEKAKMEADKESSDKKKYSMYDGKFNLVFRKAELKEIFKSIYKITGVNILYDEGFKSKKISVILKDVTIYEALKMILLQTKLFYKVIDNNTIIIIPDNPLKRKEYEELVMRTFFLGNSKPKEMLDIIRRITDIKKIVINKNLKSISVVTTPEKMKIVEKIVNINDKPKAEVMVDIEIIEVNNQRMKEYGIQLDQYSITELYSPDTGTSSADISSTGSTGINLNSSIRGHMISHTDTSDYLFLLPRIEYKIMKFDRFTKIKANPQILVLDDEKVEVKLGDKVPIPTTTFRPIATGGVNQQPITSFTMQDVGINIKITPHIHHDGWVTLDLKFELSFVSSAGDSSLPPTIGNRMVKTKIRLKDGETTVLAGLLRDKEMNSQKGFPFLSKIPILKEIFSRNKKERAQNDIILMITPRIIHFPYINKKDLISYWVGSAKHMGLKSPPVELKKIKKGENKRKPTKKNKNKRKDIKTKEITNKNNKKQAIIKKVKNKIKKNINKSVKNSLIYFAFEKKYTEKRKKIPLILNTKEKIKNINILIKYNPVKNRLITLKRGTSVNNAKNECPMVYRVNEDSGEIPIKISCPREFKPDNILKLLIFEFYSENKEKPDIDIIKAEIYDSKGKKRVLIFGGKNKKNK